ncbi:tetratricopeptide repeat protein [Lacinutrix algicola]|uniref:tetratricopeptide repeat protein n=1 Tax=Lacinutrix algicola TaxID=342954 RepID=UPI0006E125BD|nr:hypothetical protein [Lacinutrix algicola]
MKTVCILSLFFLLLISCNKAVENKNNEIEYNHKIYKNQKFKYKEAQKLNNKGIELSIEGEDALALKTFFKALSVEPDSPVILSNIGNVYNHLERYKEAIDYYESGLKFSDSSYLVIGTGLSTAYFKVGSYQKSIDICNYIASISEDDYMLFALQVHKIYSLIELNKCEVAISETKKLNKYSKNIDNPQEYIDFIEKLMEDCKSNK